MYLYEVKPIELTQGAFEPYGTVLAAGRHVEEFTLPSQMIDLEFDVDGTAHIYLIRYSRQDTVVSRFERHFSMTEARVALSGPSIMFVAGNPGMDPSNTLPGPETVRAFIISQNQGL